MSNILIEANNISKIYDQDMYLKRGINFYALHHVDFIVERGDFITVMGPSGSGKSTLMNCISTLDKVSSGKLEILQKPVLAMKEDELSDFRRNYLGFIFQNHHLISSLQGLLHSSDCAVYLFPLHSRGLHFQQHRLCLL